MLTILIAVSAVSQVEPPALDAESLRRVARVEQRLEVVEARLGILHQVKASEPPVIKPQAPMPPAATQTVMKPFTELVPVQSCSRRGCQTTFEYRTVYRPVVEAISDQAPPVITLPAPVPETELKIKEKKNKTVIKSRTTSTALDQLNMQRAQRGLRPYLFDEGLTKAAERCAQLRASQFIHGHLGGNMSDFACIEDGTQCSATGAGALEPSWGFATCCMYENYTYAGAAAVMGADGRQYCSLFVR